MKTKLAQFVYFTNKLDLRDIQFAWLVLLLAISIITKAPSDGGTGPV